jgi:hypothetical protein
MVKPRQAHLVLAQDNRSWIIEKMAARIAEHAPEHGFDVSIGDAERGDADINHWMSYAFANVPHNTPATMLITHLDDPYKVGLVKNELAAGVDVGIALSSHTCDMLAAAGVPEKALAFAVPGHDFAASPRRVVIGLTTRLYADGRKREAMLLDLARAMRLDRFRFEIFGMGWEAVIPELEAAGAEVGYWPGTDDFRADYVEMMGRVPQFDYYLYLGRDEGSLGTLDALAAGVKTIVTPQGFHVDLPGGITHAVWSQDELEAVFRDIGAEAVRRANAVAGLTWQAYAEAHAIVWTAILDGRREAIAGLLSAQRGFHTREVEPIGESRATMLRRLVSPYRVRSALSHIPLLKPVRAWIKGR